MSAKAVAQAFGKAARHYAAHAHIQQQAAQNLMHCMSAVTLPAAPRILEVGCGVGFLTRLLLARWPDARLVCTDLALDMALSCRQALGASAPGLTFAVMDGEQPAVRGGFDLVISSMVAQWFSNPQQGLQHLTALTRPGGIMAFATLGPATLRQWRQACQQVGLPCPTPSYPEAATLTQWLAPLGECRVVEEYLTESIPSPMTFFKGLRAIGATRALDAAPLPGGQLRQALSVMAHVSDSLITWHLLHGLVVPKG